MKFTLDGPHFAHLRGGPLDGQIFEVRGTCLVPWPECGGRYVYRCEPALIGGAVHPLFTGTWVPEDTTPGPDRRPPGS